MENKKVLSGQMGRPSRTAMSTNRRYETESQMVMSGAESSLFKAKDALVG